MNANQRLEEKEKALQNAEGEVAALNRRVASLEEDLEKSEERLLTATQKLDLAATAGDDSQRMCKVLENKALSDEARMESLENQLKDARILAEEADKNTMTLPRNCKWLSPTSTAQKKGPTLVKPRSLNSKKS